MAKPAAGVYHSYAPLWLVNPAGAGYAAGHDCRCQFGPLPVVSYGYAYGATAIGQDLVSSAPKPKNASVARRNESGLVILEQAHPGGSPGGMD